MGPGACTLVSKLSVLDVVVDDSAKAGGGGGSITDPGEGLDKGSGRDGIASSEDEVSIVICLVAGGVCLRV